MAEHGERVAVIGAGLSGLTVAYRLLRAGRLVDVYGAHDRIGGQLWTDRRTPGFVVELGAEGFVAKSLAVPSLARDVGVAEHLIDQVATLSYRFDGEALIALSPGEAAEALSFQVSRADKGAGIRSFALGMQELSDALSASTFDSALATRKDPAVRVTIDAARPCVDGTPYRDVVIATSCAEAAVLLGHAGEMREVAEANKPLSSVTVSLGYAASAVQHPLSGTGFVVATDAPRFSGFRACTFTSSKFAHRAPPGHVSLRLFFRPKDDEELELSSEAWTARARQCIEQVLPTSAPPVRAWVSRWARALPVYTDAYRAAVAELEARLAPRRVWLTGSAFHGSGIDAAVRSAEAVSERVLSERK